MQSILEDKTNFYLIDDSRNTAIKFFNFIIYDIIRHEYNFYLL